MRAWAGRLRLDRFELATLAALALFSVTVIAVLATRGRPLSGADGQLAVDQLQYFTWIREASNHVLIGNLFDLAPGERSFLHPGFLLSGALSALSGISFPLSYQLWKPVAVLVTFLGSLLYVRRFVPAGGARRVALVLALFAVMPASAAVAWTGWGGKPRQYTFDFISGEMWSGQYLWGYLMTAIAVFLVPLVLLAIERWREEPEANGRMLWLAALGALLVTWLQPWQGATLGLIVVVVELVSGLRASGFGRRRSAVGSRPGVRWALLLPLGAALLPAVYYAVLGATDASWELASESNAAGAQAEWSWPWWAIALTVLPLAAPAALAYRLPAPGWQDVALRVWPFAALAVYLLPVGTFPYHAFQGLTLPLAILAVIGVLSVWQRPRPALVLAAVALLTLPGLAHKLEVVKTSVEAGGDPFYVFPGEVEALEALERDERPGGVLSATYAGYMVPYRTGRETWIGPFSWTPDWKERQRKADGLFEGRIRGQAARAVVLESRARFLFKDCRKGLVDLEADLTPLLESVDRYGCATVYVLRERPAMRAAAGPPDA